MHRLVERTPSRGKMTTMKIRPPFHPVRPGTIPLLAALLLAGCGGSDDGGSTGPTDPPAPPSNADPTASFTVQTTGSAAPVGALFDARTSSDSDGQVVSGLLALKMVYGAAKAGVPGMLVFLDDDADGELDGSERSAETGVGGIYQFDGVSPGEHRVTQALSVGWSREHLVVAIDHF